MALKRITLALLMTCFLIPASARVEGVESKADADGPAQTEYVPASGSGRVVILVLGSGGQSHYQDHAQRVVELGYYAVLVNGDDIRNGDGKDRERLEAVIRKAQQSPHALPGKVALVGYSIGGGAVLAAGVTLPEQVAVAIAYYPTTVFIKNTPDALRGFASKIQVPTLVFAGGKDTFKGCCLIERIQAADKAAQEQGAPFKLVVYPHSGHSFDHPEYAGAPYGTGILYNAADALDAWQRTVDELKKYLVP